MDIKKLEEKLSALFLQIIESRNSANAALDEYTKLRHWITEQEIARMEKERKRTEGA